MGFSAMGERLQDTQPLRGHGLQWGGGSSSLTDELAVLQAETKKRMSGMWAGGTSGWSSPSQSPPRWGFLPFSFHPQLWLPCHILQDVSGVNMFPAAGWCNHMLLVLRKNLWGQNISLPLYGLCHQRGLHLLQVFLSCAVPFSVLLQHHLQLAVGPWAELSWLSPPCILSRLWDSFGDIFCPPLCLLTMLLGTGQQTWPQHAVPLPLVLVVQAQNPHLCFSLFIALHLTASH